MRRFLTTLLQVGGTGLSSGGPTGLLARLGGRHTGRSAEAPFDASARTCDLVFSGRYRIRTCDLLGVNQAL